MMKVRTQSRAFPEPTRHGPEIARDTSSPERNEVAVQKSELCFADRERLAASGPCSRAPLADRRTRALAATQSKIDLVVRIFNQK